MKKSEVIKVLKEGTHCIYNDCPEKLGALSEIISQIKRKDFVVFGLYKYYRIEDEILHFGNLRPKQLGIINLSEIEPDNENPYLYFEGEKYFFGEEYEFSVDGEKYYLAKLQIFDISRPYGFISNGEIYKHIRKIDHTTKYKKLFLELKEQAEKDGVNLKELI